MSKPKAPKPPDPAQLAQQQQQSNQQAAQQTLSLNALDRSGPFGSVRFTRDAAGVPTGQTVTLNPELQQTVDRAGATASNLAGLLPQDRFRLADVPQGIDLQQNFFDAQKALLQPGFDEQIRDFEIRAAERGLPVGSEGFTGLLDPVLRNQNRALQQAAFGAVQLTPQEEQRQIQNALLERQLPFQETGAALGLLGQVPVPSFAPQPSAAVNATNVAGLQQQQFQNEQALARDRNAALGSILGAGAGIVGTALGGPFGGALGQRLFGGGGDIISNMSVGGPFNQGPAFAQ